MKLNTLFKIGIIINGILIDMTKIKEREAIRTLEEIAKGSGTHSLAREPTLSEWRKENLKS